MAETGSAHRATSASSEAEGQSRAARARHTSEAPQRAQQGTPAASAAPAALDSLSRLQRLADASPRVAQLRRLQALADAAAGLPSPTDTVEAAPPNRTGLPDGLKAGVESLSGLSMDHVRVHYNSAQPAQLNALAYAQGSDIHLAPGQEQHLPLETSHFGGQRIGLINYTMHMNETNDANAIPDLEKGADKQGLLPHFSSMLPNKDIVQTGLHLLRPVIQRVELTPEEKKELGATVIRLLEGNIYIKNKQIVYNINQKLVKHGVNLIACRNYDIKDLKDTLKKLLEDNFKDFFDVLKLVATATPTLIAKLESQLEINHTFQGIKELSANDLVSSEIIKEENIQENNQSQNNSKEDKKNQKGRENLLAKEPQEQKENHDKLAKEPQEQKENHDKSSVERLEDISKNNRELLKDKIDKLFTALEGKPDRNKLLENIKKFYNTILPSYYDSPIVAHASKNKIDDRINSTANRQKASEFVRELSGNKKVSKLTNTNDMNTKHFNSHNFTFHNIYPNYKSEDYKNEVLKKTRFLKNNYAVPNSEISPSAHTYFSDFEQLFTPDENTVVTLRDPVYPSGGKNDEESKRRIEKDDFVTFQSSKQGEYKFQIGNTPDIEYKTKNNIFAGKEDIKYALSDNVLEGLLRLAVYSTDENAKKLERNLGEALNAYTSHLASKTEETAKTLDMKVDRIIKYFQYPQLLHSNFVKVSADPRNTKEWKQVTEESKKPQESQRSKKKK